MDGLIRKEVAIDALKAIKYGLWEIDIPHPSNCPEYIEHHQQIQAMMEIVDMWIDKIKDTEPDYPVMKCSKIAVVEKGEKKSEIT